MATQATPIPSSPSIKMDSAPIGIFDSGVGGLSVYLHLKQQLPDEQYLYYADTLNVPYGPRSSAEIKELTLIAVDWLVQSGCKLIVIACNSASAHALQLARHKYPHIPIVGLVPALKPAVLNSNSKSVAVLATKATLDGELLNTVISDYALPAQVNVVKWFDPNLVPWVEAGMPIQSETPERLKAQLKNFAQQKVDHLVLGCTHYPFFREFVMSQIADENLGIKVVDSGAAIAARVKTLLQQSQSLAASKQVEASNESLYIGHSDQERDDLSLAQSTLSFFVSDPKADLAEVSKLVNRLIHR
ncbi:MULTISPECIES: glutamate racemase [Psychrobacter]|uniref:Glutamate racemase n=2 Tax=Psychrobacter TaxID=497 RepID=A0A1R4GAU8_9GAMM|nr:MULTISPECIES: glutamate racemase [Psychrobacter]SJM36936.1 Glutamate racemase 2 [Psychrobacter pasteurii]SJM65311.1 Glutamate racemase 2 [Psychrobacter piechaudii]